MRPGPPRPDRPPEATSRGIARLLAALVTLAALAAAPAGPAAAFDLTAVGGGETDFRGQSYLYGGLEATQRLGEHVAAAGRVVPFYLTYRYRSDGDLVDAKAPGVNAAVGVRLFWGPTTLGLLGGIEYRHTDLSPDDPFSSVSGAKVGGLVQADFDTWLPTRTNLNLWASFTSVDDFVYVKGTVKQQLTNRDFAQHNTVNGGTEVFYGRNENFDMVGVGVVLELFRLPASLSLAVRGGWKHDSTFGHGGYGGVSLSKRF